MSIDEFIRIYQGISAGWFLGLQPRIMPLDAYVSATVWALTEGNHEAFRAAIRQVGRQA